METPLKDFHHTNKTRKNIFGTGVTKLKRANCVEEYQNLIKGAKIKGVQNLRDEGKLSSFFLQSFAVRWKFGVWKCGNPT